MEIVISEDEFYEQYHPIKNHLDENASFDGCMFETYDEELEYVKSMVETGKVWTILDGEGDNLLYSSGYHFVNRIGYLITEESVEVGLEIIVNIIE